MSEFDEALAALDRAVTRLEETIGAAAEQRMAERRRKAEAAQELASRVDAALARLDQVLGEGG